MSAKQPWNVNRLLVLAGALVTIVACVLFYRAVPAVDMLAPFAPGILAALVLAFWAPAWMYLVAGLLLAAFPLVVLFVFGAYQALLHPGGGAEADALLLLLLGAALALIGGIAGFVQARRGAAPPANAFLRAPQGLAGALALALVAGLLLSSFLAAADHRALATAPADNLVPDETIRMSTGNAVFAPRNLTIPAGKLVALHITNEDKMMHTFTYHMDGVERTSLIPPASEIDLYFKLDAPQTIHFWCAPHSEGEADRKPDSMWGELQVA